MANILMPDCLVKLNNLLQAIENAPVECDGHTLMISSALNHAGISHQRMCGVVKNPKTYFELYPHFWIEIGEFTLDYRLRMWVELYSGGKLSGNDSNLLIVFYVQIVPDNFVMQLHRFGERQGLPAQPCQMLSQIQVVSLNSLRVTLTDDVQFSLQT